MTNSSIILKGLCANKQEKPTTQSGNFQEELTAEFLGDALVYRPHETTRHDHFLLPTANMDSVGFQKVTRKKGQNMKTNILKVFQSIYQFNTTFYVMRFLFVSCK